MAAYAFYQENSYDEAINALDRFIELHPGSPDAPYAYYLKAISYYEQIVDVRRDQKATADALNALEELVRRFPDSKYARDAELQIDLALDDRKRGAKGRSVSVRVNLGGTRSIKKTTHKKT